MNLSVSDINRFSMISNSSLEQSHFKIICYQNVSFQFDNIYSLWIRGLKFIGCGNNLIMSVSNFTVESSTFNGQRDSGTALWIIRTNVSIESSRFILNKVGSCVGPFVGPSHFLTLVVQLVHS